MAGTPVSTVLPTTGVGPSDPRIAWYTIGGTNSPEDGKIVQGVILVDPATGQPAIANSAVAGAAGRLPATPFRRRRIKPQWAQAYFTSTVAGTYFGAPMHVDAYDELLVFFSLSATITGVTTAGTNISCFLQLSNYKDDITLATSWINHPVDATPTVIATPTSTAQVFQVKQYTNFGGLVRTGITIGTAWNATGNQNINALIVAKG